MQTIPGTPSECAMTADNDIDIHKTIMDRENTLLREVTQITNLLDKPPDTDISHKPLNTNIPNRNNPLDTNKPPDRDIPNRPPKTDIPSNRPLDTDMPNRPPNTDR